jgi:hypothetical protein
MEAANRTTSITCNANEITSTLLVFADVCGTNVARGYDVSMTNLEGHFMLVASDRANKIHLSDRKSENQVSHRALSQRKTQFQTIYFRSQSWHST